MSGLCTFAGSGDPTLREGLATHTYVANTSMTQKAFVNSDGEFLIIPERGALDIQTEFGPLFVQPGEIVVIQRGIRFRVALPDGPSRGYLLEIWGSHFELPELGPLGANGLANARDFLTPTATYEITKEPWEIVYKLGGKFFKSTQNHSPFDVVAWHGNYVRPGIKSFGCVKFRKTNKILMGLFFFAGAIQIRPDEIRQCRLDLCRSYRPVDFLCADRQIEGRHGSLGGSVDFQSQMGCCFA